MSHQRFQKGIKKIAGLYINIAESKKYQIKY